LNPTRTKKKKTAANAATKSANARTLKQYGGMGMGGDMGYMDSSPPQQTSGGMGPNGVTGRGGGSQAREAAEASAFGADAGPLGGFGMSVEADAPGMMMGGMAAGGGAGLALPGGASGPQAAGVLPPGVAPPPGTYVVDPRKGRPVYIEKGQTFKMTWTTAPPHPDVVMCCGGALQLTWSPMDGGVDRSVTLNSDATCPSEIANREFVTNIVQAAPRGVALLNFDQNGDYYVSSNVGTQCVKSGMQFLLAVRGCKGDSPAYAPTTPLNVDCNKKEREAAAAQAEAQMAAAAAAKQAAQQELQQAAANGKLTLGLDAAKEAAQVMGNGAGERAVMAAATTVAAVAAAAAVLAL
jgi:hypothetical protein